MTGDRAAVTEAESWKNKNKKKKKYRYLHPGRGREKMSNLLHQSRKLVLQMGYLQDNNSQIYTTQHLANLAPKSTNITKIHTGLNNSIIFNELLQSISKYLSKTTQDSACQILHRHQIRRDKINIKKRTLCLNEI